MSKLKIVLVSLSNLPLYCVPYAWSGVHLLTGTIRCGNWKLVSRLEGQAVASGEEIGEGALGAAGPEPDAGEGVPDAAAADVAGGAAPLPDEEAGKGAAPLPPLLDEGTGRGAAALVAVADAELAAALLEEAAAELAAALLGKTAAELAAMLLGAMISEVTASLLEGMAAELAMILLGDTISELAMTLLGAAVEVGTTMTSVDDGIALEVVELMTAEELLDDEDEAIASLYRFWMNEIASESYSCGYTGTQFVSLVALISYPGLSYHNARPHQSRGSIADHRHCSMNGSYSRRHRMRRWLEGEGTCHCSGMFQR